MVFKGKIGAYSISPDGTKIYYEFYKGKSVPTILFFPVGYNTTRAKLFKEILIKNDISFLLFDYRCHGKSQNGKIDLDLIMSDVKNILAKKKIDKYITAGFCSGTGFAYTFHLKNKSNSRKIILEDIASYKTTLNYNAYLVWFVSYLAVLIKDILRIKVKKKNYIDWGNYYNISIYKLLKLIRNSMSFRDFLKMIDLSLNIEFKENIDFLIMSSKHVFFDKNKVRLFTSRLNAKTIVKRTDCHKKCFIESKEDYMNSKILVNLIKNIENPKING